ncbi:MAG: enoyl-CoA hydratase/isomerase family protein, partial [Myxococcota bacterium]
MIDLQRHGDVFVLKLDRDENRFRPDFLAAIASALDEVEAAGNPAALVTTGAGRFYSNGLDLDWMNAQEREDAAAYMSSVLALFARTLTFP